MKMFMFATCLIAVVCAFVCVVLVVGSLATKVQRGFLSKSGLSFYGGAEPKKSRQLEWMFRNGVNCLKKPSKFLLDKVCVVKKTFQEFVDMLSTHKITSDPISALSTFMALSILVLFVGSILFDSIIAGIAIVLLLIAIFVTSLHSHKEKMNDKLRQAIPQSLSGMSSCFESGYTLLQTFEFLGNQGEDSLSALYASCANKLNTGATIPQALDLLHSQKSIPELVFISVALDVQHQSGGSMGPVIEAAKDMVENRLDLLRKLSVQTAQAKLSARVVTILPFALIACFSVISPDFLSPFFSSVIGFFVLSLAVIMQVAGIICVRKMLNVEV